MLVCVFLGRDACLEITKYTWQARTGAPQKPHKLRMLLLGDEGPLLGGILEKKTLFVEPLCKKWLFFGPKLRNLLPRSAWRVQMVGLNKAPRMLGSELLMPYLFHLLKNPKKDATH